MQALEDTNKKVTDKLNQDNDELNKKLNKRDSVLEDTKTLIKQALVKNKTSFSDKKYSIKVQYPTTVVTDKKKAPQLEGGNSAKIGGMWNLKHDITPQKWYELLTNIGLKVDTALDLKNFYNHINMCLNAVTRLWEELIPDYHSIKIHSDFE